MQNLTYQINHFKVIIALVSTHDDKAYVFYVLAKLTPTLVTEEDKRNMNGNLLQICV